MAVLEDPRFREHAGPDGHPERPERLAAVAAAIAARSEPLARLAPRPADDAELLRVHAREHVERLRALSSRAPLQLDADTYLGPRSVEVAELAAGGLIDLCRAVVRRDALTGLASLRPPGHHAEAGRAMGFCLYNNVAIGAAYARARGLSRVAVVDYDVHHGNGTQWIFYEDPAVLYISSHQYPYYPGTGAAEETGRGAGLGYTLNLPLEAGAGDRDVMLRYEREALPKLEWFRPELLLVSAGFDAHVRDPLAGCRMTTAGFRALSGLLVGAADRLCGGRVVLVTEGGYDLTALAECLEAVLDVCR